MTNTNRPVTEFSHKTSTELPQERSQGLNVDPTDVNARPDLDTNRVPDMNEAGDHPVDTSVGVLGGAATGAAVGAAAGPVGAVVGGIAGGVVGGLAGNEIADAIDPTAEDVYWRDQYQNRPYYNETRSVYADVDYDRDYRGAYRLGYENRPLYEQNVDFDRAEPELRTKWEQMKGDSRLNWEEAKFAAKDAWQRVTR
ncbi:hypothetical protein [Acinetobacter indicus]|uniref:hypothetical protein n=1 Tax=Acinetobacter indicus TaxID=756892 RepID=UPI000CECBE4D|nr:hypothetical protein [Acinetobacter indicus]